MRQLKDPAIKKQALFKLKYAFRGKNIFLGQRTQRLPNGRLAHVDVVLHPGAVLIVPFLTKDKIIFLRQYRPALNKFLYELPAGTLDRGESIGTCAKRELIEETGFTAAQLKRLGKIYPVPGYSNEIIYIYRATQLKREYAEKDQDEIISTRVFNPLEIKRLFNSGKIVDAKTICALALTRLL